MAGRKCIHIFDLKQVCTSGCSRYGLEAIPTKFVEQKEPVVRVGLHGLCFMD